MLDEYAEDFGTGLSNEFSEAQRRQIKGSPLPYQNNYIPSDQNIAVPPPQPSVQNYPPPQYNAYPVYPQQPAPQYIPPQPQNSASQPKNRLDTIFPEESKELNELLRAEERAGCLKNIFFVFLALGIIAVSFWGSFLVGKKFFLPSTYHMQKEELPAFLMKQTKNKLKNTLENAKKITQQSEDLFKVVEAPREVPANVVPPEVKNKPYIIGAEEKLTEPKTFPAAEPKPYVAPIKTTVRPPVKKAASSGLALYRVIAGSYDTKQMAEDAAVNLRNDGFPNFIYFGDGKYRIQIGAFKSRERATEYMQKAREYGYNPVISVR